MQEKKDDQETSDLIVRTKVRYFNLVLLILLLILLLLLSVSLVRCWSINSRLGEPALKQNRLGVGGSLHVSGNPCSPKPCLSRGDLLE